MGEGVDESARFFASARAAGDSSGSSFGQARIPKFGRSQCGLRFCFECAAAGPLRFRGRLSGFPYDPQG